jgi:two-component system NtrC family sensor kinase
MELIDLMMQASHAALTVTGELKAYAHQSHNVIARVDLHDQVRSSVRMFGQWKGDLTVNLEFGDDPLMIDCVPSRLLMVFTNLVKNAFEAMDNNGEVTITSERDGDWAILKVRDTGPGVPEDYRPNLFQPFHTTKKQGEGLGLGLSLAHKVVHESGGELSYDASYTDGAQFLIRLPLA